MSGERTSGGPNGADGANGTVRSTGRQCALVVEDEAFVAFDLEDMLLDIGFEEVEVRASYEGAEAALDTGSYDLAVFDLNLDGRLSVPLVMRARGMGIPVIVASGYTAERVPLPANDIPRVVKPYRPADIRRLVESV